MPVTEDLLAQLRTRLLEVGPADVSPSYRLALSDSIAASARLLLSDAPGPDLAYPPGSGVAVLRVTQANLGALARDLAWLLGETATDEDGTTGELGEDAATVELLRDVHLLLEWMSDRLLGVIEREPTRTDTATAGAPLRSGTERRANWLSAFVIGRAQAHEPTDEDRRSAVTLTNGDLDVVERAREKIKTLQTLGAPVRERAAALLDEVQGTLVTTRLRPRN